MATITPTNSERGVGVHDVITWADMAAGDTCTFNTRILYG